MNRMLLALIVLAACDRTRRAPDIPPLEPPAAEAATRAPVAFDLGWLPARFSAVMYAPKHAGPLLAYLSSLFPERPACAPRILEKVERSFQLAEALTGPMTTVVEGALTRDEVEACIADVGAELRLELRRQQDGAVTVYTGATGRAMAFGFADHRIVVGDDRATVAALASATDDGGGIRGTPLAALLARLPVDRLGIAATGVETLARNLFGVAATGMLVEMLSEEKRVVGSARFLAASPADADQIVANLAAFTSRRDVNEAARRAVVHATAHREGTEVVLDLGGLLDDPAALQGLVELAQGAAPR